MIVDATRVTVTTGTYMGEEGAGYRWGAPGTPQGGYQGHEELCRVEVPDGSKLVPNGYGELLLVVPLGTRDGDGYEIDPADRCMDAQEAFVRGLARRVPAEEVTR